ncbi:MAG: 16S rRNA (cytosine(1402)-N(4))-methyltransferase RsmH [Flavobacteriaceae bacterium]
MTYHKPVLLDEAIKGLMIRPSGVYVDVTFGGGGHSQAILDQLDTNGKLYGFDQDVDAQANALEDIRFDLIPANFSFLKQYLKFKGVTQVHGILADFGVSSHQFDSDARGFSTRFDGPLDMRMNIGQEVSAASVVNTYSESQLGSIFRTYGEIRNAHRIASAIVKQRQEQSFNTTKQLRDLVAELVPERFLNKNLAQVFQAIRIEVNQELEVLKQFLEQSAEVLIPGGRLVCISYHSLEDRLVKRFIREGRFEGKAVVDFYGNKECPFKKVGGLVVPNKAEIAVNNRARSAKMRIAEKR